MSHPIVTIEMESGAVMTGELYPELAPQHRQQLHRAGKFWLL